MAVSILFLCFKHSHVTWFLMETSNVVFQTLFEKNLAYFKLFLELWMAVYPSNMAPIGLKVCQNAFRTIPDILFSHAENANVSIISRALKCRLPPRGWLHLAWNFGKTHFRRFQHFIFRRRQLIFFWDFWSPESGVRHWLVVIISGWWLVISD